MIEIRYNGRLVLTTTQAAERLKVTPGTVRARASREGITPATHLDPRTPLYYPEDLGIKSMEEHPMSTQTLMHWDDGKGGERTLCGLDATVREVLTPVTQRDVVTCPRCIEIELKHRSEEQ